MNYSHCTITRPLNELVILEYRYFFYEDTLWLDSYRRMERPTKRHKFRTYEWYNRLDNRDSPIKNPEEIPNRPDPDEVIAHFLAELKSKVTVKNWKN